MQCLVLIGDTTFCCSQNNLEHVATQHYCLSVADGLTHLNKLSQARAAMATFTCIAMRQHAMQSWLAIHSPFINSASRSVIFAAAGSEDSRSHDRQKTEKNICFLSLLLYSLFMNVQILSSWRRFVVFFK